MKDDIKVAHLLKYSMALTGTINELWSTFQVVFESVDLEDPEINERVLGILAELEYNLTDMLDQVNGAAYVLTGVYEPLPYEHVEDFEASILRDIAALDSVDLGEYRSLLEDDDE